MARVPMPGSFFYKRLAFQGLFAAIAAHELTTCSRSVSWRDPRDKCPIGIGGLFAAIAAHELTPCSRSVSWRDPRWGRPCNHSNDLFAEAHRFFFICSRPSSSKLGMAFVQIKNPIRDRVVGMVAVRGGFEPPVP